MDQCTRRIVGFGVNRGVVDGVALCHICNRAIGRQPAPTYLSSDHDPLYRYHQWQANLRILDVAAIKTVPFAPLSHPFVERLIGTIRRECLDRTLFWTAADLEVSSLISNAILTVIARTRDSAGGRRNRARTRAARGRVSVSIAGGPTVVGCIRRRSRHDRVRRRRGLNPFPRDVDRLNATRVSSSLTETFRQYRFGPG